MRNNLPQFQTDYLLSWDFSDKDFPCVAVSRIERKGSTVVAEIIGRSHAAAGCVSLRQALEEHEARQREEEKRMSMLREHLKEAGEAATKATASVSAMERTPTPDGVQEVKT